MTKDDVIKHLNNGKSIQLNTGLFYWIEDSKIFCSAKNGDKNASLSFYQSIEDIFLENTLESIKLIDTNVKNTGLSTNYYKLNIPSPANLEQPYICECQDIIERLGMTFNEGECFKALWRKAARRTLGVSKEGVDGLYDAEKIKYFGKRVYEQEKNDENGK